MIVFKFIIITNMTVLYSIMTATNMIILYSITTTNTSLHSNTGLYFSADISSTSLMDLCYDSEPILRMNNRNRVASIIVATPNHEQS